MHIPLRGCCTDSPGSDDLATTRQTYLVLACLFGAASLVVAAFNVFFA